MKRDKKVKRGRPELFGQTANRMTLSFLNKTKTQIHIPISSSSRTLLLLFMCMHSTTSIHHTN